MNRNLLILQMLLFYSCISMPMHKYEIENSTNKLNLSNKSLKILFFEDLRKGENVNKNLLAFIPFFISGRTELNFPEHDEISINTPFKFFIADIFENEISSMFSLKKLIVTNDSTLPTDYTIHGAINKSYCERRLYTYGLSMYGVLLWYLGVPAMAHECDFELKIFLVDSKKSALFSKTYQEKKTIYAGLYYNLNNLNRIYTDILRNIMKEIKTDLRANLKN
ncbi:hypothetical protein ACO2KH_12955 [Leptospira terpstrae]|uniref:hypothetical protein n=1 Tax=Leptospira terpstrae TaxID=293075 RepID=UPI003D03C411